MLMTLLATLSKTISTTLVLALVCLLALGSLGGAATAATGDHHSIAAMEDMPDGETNLDVEMTVAAPCLAKTVSVSHDVGDGSCCVGTCTVILDVGLLAEAPARRISEIAPLDHPILARARTVEFLRPPSLKF